VDGRRRSRGRGERFLVVELGSMFRWQVLNVARRLRVPRVVVIVVLLAMVFVAEIVVWRLRLRLRRARPCQWYVVCYKCRVSMLSSYARCLSAQLMLRTQFLVVRESSVV
jgi:hypothetical protein